MNGDIRTSDNINEIAAALAKAQSELENVTKDKKNEHFKAAYATLAGVLEEVRPKLAKNGIAILQMPVNGEGSNVGIATRLIHSSGQWIESTVYVAPARFDAQGVGSVLTYLRRYSLMAMAGVGPEDDDGEAAIGRPQTHPQTNGATRTAGTPPVAAPPASRAVNKAALPPSPEEVPEVTAARQRIKMLIGKYQQIIKAAPHARALELAFDDGREEINEIEQAGEKGEEAVKELLRRYMVRMQEFDMATAPQ